MDKFFNHREYCIASKQTSRHGKTFLFEFPNGQKIEVSRDMSNIEEWLGYWRVASVAVNGIRVECYYGHKRPREVARFLKWVKELEVP